VKLPCGCCQSRPLERPEGSKGSGARQRGECGWGGSTARRAPLALQAACPFLLEDFPSHLLQFLRVVFVAAGAGFTRGSFVAKNDVFLTSPKLGTGRAVCELVASEFELICADFHMHENRTPTTGARSRGPQFLVCRKPVTSALLLGTFFPLEALLLCAEHLNRTPRSVFMRKRRRTVGFFGWKMRRPGKCWLGTFNELDEDEDDCLAYIGGGAEDSRKEAGSSTSGE
jgi:hypothetical protein